MEIDIPKFGDRIYTEDKMKLIHKPPRRDAIPRYADGEVIGSLTVIKHIEFTDYNLSESKNKKSEWLAKKQHWYSVECECGEKEISSQDQLRSRGYCRACAEELRREHLCKIAARVPKPLPDTTLPEGVPDFALLPPPSCIKTKPETLARIEAAI